MDTIDLTPSPEGYRSMLRMIIKTSSSKVDREWARDELARVKNVTAWSKKES